MRTKRTLTASNCDSLYPCMFLHWRYRTKCGLNKYSFQFFETSSTVKYIINCSIFKRFNNIPQCTADRYLNNCQIVSKRSDEIYEKIEKKQMQQFLLQKCLSHQITKNQRDKMKMEYYYYVMKNKLYVQLKSIQNFLFFFEKSLPTGTHWLILFILVVN